MTNPTGTPQGTHDEALRAAVDDLNIAWAALEESRGFGRDLTVTEDLHLRHWLTIRAALPDAGRDRAAELEAWKRRAVMLWDLLDNIDTAEDMAKGDLAWFFKAAHKQHQKRFQLANSDGYTLEWKPLDAALGAPGTPGKEGE